MRPSDFDVSSHRRSAMALLVLGESGSVDPQEKGRLLDAMWDGWRRVMCIRFRASFDNRRRERGNHHSE